MPRKNKKRKPGQKRQVNKRNPFAFELFTSGLYKQRVIKDKRKEANKKKARTKPTREELSE